MLIKRNLSDRLFELLHRKEIIVIRGPRQAGKTTLLHMLEAKIDEGYEKAFINIEMPDYKREFETNPLGFVKRFKNERPLILFIDEIQRCTNAGQGLKLIYDTDKDVKLIVSGSSSLDFKANILPFLVGRAFVFNLLPFSFEEFLRAKEPKLMRIFEEQASSVKRFIENGEEIITPIFSQEFFNYLKEYVVFGGYPEVVMSPPKEKTLILNSIRGLYIEKDVMAFFKIYDTTKFEDFVKTLAFQTANILQLSTLSKSLGLNIRKVEEFLEILQHTYIVGLVRPFYRNLVTELRKARKCYYLDLGIRNSIIGNFLEFEKREDQGKLIENFIYRELIDNFRDWDLKYWRTTAKAEVDFILTKNDKIVPIEVRLFGRPGRSFYSFCETYNPERAIIVTLDHFDKERIGKTDVYYVPAFYF